MNTTSPIRPSVTLTVRGGSASWKTNNKRSSSRQIQVLDASEFGTSSPSNSVEKRRRKRISRFAHALAALRRKPKRHIVLNFDRTEREWSPDEAAEVFKKFSTYLQKNFPKSWFVWIMEFTPKTGPHYHMLGSFGGKFSSKAIFEKWQDLTKSEWEEAAVIDKFHKAHVGYLSKPSKAKGTRYLIRHLGGKGFWGIINRKNMPLHEKQTFTLTNAQFQVFRSTLKALLIRHGAAQSSIDRLEKGCNGLRYCTHEMIQEALAAAGLVQR